MFVYHKYMSAKKSVQPTRLALHGGKPVLKKPHPPVYTVGKREIAAVMKVLKTGPLSDFIGVAGKDFLGGSRVLAFEKAFTKKFKVKHAVSFNSATTALHGAIVALGIGPGDEVIVPPYTMSASAMCVIQNGAVPVFADIDPDTFCIDAESITKCITPRTKAIMVVNLFGQAADFGRILPIAKKHGLKIIEDNAQAPGAKWKGKYAGTVGDIGVFSFNFHKTMQSGEGGVLVTNHHGYALRAQLSRNHGESVVVGMAEYNAGPIFGSNYRMTEITAAIAEVQLSRLDDLNRKNQALVKYLAGKLAGIPGLTLPHIPAENTHVYFTFAMKIDEALFGITRDMFVKAMRAEGFPMSRGYVEPLYLLPVFQEQKAFNHSHFPFQGNHYAGSVNYAKGLCPVTERLHYTELTFTQLCQHPRTKKDIDLFVRAFKKVLAHKNTLQ